MLCIITLLHYVAVSVQTNGALQVKFTQNNIVNHYVVGHDLIIEMFKFLLKVECSNNLEKSN